MSTWLVIAAIAVAAASGGPALLAARHRNAGQRLCSVLQLVAAALGSAGAVLALARGAGAEVRVNASAMLPELSFGLDALSAVFALPVCLLCACTAVYDLGYWPQAEHPRGGRQLRVFCGLLLAALLSLLLARDGIAFLIAWEAMALSAFFLVTAEHRRPEVRGAGWIYLAATHAGTLLLFAFFCCLAAATGSFALAPSPPGAISAAERDALFVLALAGFGLKAGVVPLHFWLPPAHAAAPSHVSAVMSSVLIKMGIYGLMRTGWLLPAPPIWWGQAVLGAGAVSALVGVAFAIGQHDLKRLLAYHSIENIGIICLGLGVALLGGATARHELIVLGLAGAVLHVWNHALFKGLLFFAAGATIQRAGTGEIDRLGGIARAMPWTAAAFLGGAVAISGLPPLNGFVSELLTYLALFATLAGDSATATIGAIAIPALAFTGAMALLCFVKVFGIVYLGAPRSDRAREAREVGPALLVPMAVLALACAAIGLAPLAAAPALEPVISDWMAVQRTGADAPELAALAPLGLVGACSTALTAAAAFALAWLHRRRTVPAPAIGTWDCGYALAAPTIQYTAASFAQMFVSLAHRLLWPRSHRLRSNDLFPQAAGFYTHVPDPILDRLLLPLLRHLASACNWLRLLQRGRVQVYLLYVLVTLLVLLLL